MKSTTEQLVSDVRQKIADLLVNELQGDNYTHIRNALQEAAELFNPSEWDGAVKPLDDALQTSSAYAACSDEEKDYVQDVLDDVREEVMFEEYAWLEHDDVPCIEAY